MAVEVQGWLYLAYLICLLCSLIGFSSGFLFLTAFTTGIFPSIVPFIVTLFLSSVFVALYLILVHMEKLIAKQKPTM
jgi:hypothetical protein